MNATLIKKVPTVFQAEKKQNKQTKIRAALKALGYSSQTGYMIDGYENRAQIFIYKDNGYNEYVGIFDFDKNTFVD